MSERLSVLEQYVLELGRQKWTGLTIKPGVGKLPFLAFREWMIDIMGEPVKGDDLTGGGNWDIVYDILWIRDAQWATLIKLTWDFIGSKTG